jgi:hypothetical protein
VDAPPKPPTLWERLGEFATRAGAWIVEHREEIEAFAAWGTINTACTEAKLYAPLQGEAWAHLQPALRAPGADPAAVILATYGPDGVGFPALRAELAASDLLADRRVETDEVVLSLMDGRYYVCACGALPLIEYVISKAAGKWNAPDKHVAVARSRLHHDEISDHSRLLLDSAAVQMVLEVIPDVWADSPQQVGAVVAELRRHWVLHGTGRGWDNAANATRALLLLAACARVADALFDRRL